jgi:tetratricopeptide (TPR) repeat protein
MALFGPSCSLLPGAAGPSTTETQIIADTARQTQEQMALGNYKRALEIYSLAHDKHRLPGLKQDHARLGEQIRAASDTAYQKGNFAEAGSAYRILFESGITTRDFADSLSFDDDYLRRQIEACSKALMEIGLVKYREEKLEEAIAIWKKILLFDAHNKNVKKAIDIATVQLQRIQNIK